MCLGDLSEAKTSELLSSASHRDEGPRLRCPGNVLLGAGVPSGTPGPCVRHLWAAFCSLPCWTGRSGPRGHLTGGGPHPVACSPRQVAPLLGSSWRSRPGSGGPGRVGRAVVLGVGGGACGPRGRRDGWQVARPGQLCPEEQRSMASGQGSIHVLRKRGRLSRGLQGSRTFSPGLCDRAQPPGSRFPEAQDVPPPRSRSSGQGHPNWSPLLEAHFTPRGREAPRAALGQSRPRRGFAGAAMWSGPGVSAGQ